MSDSIKTGPARQEGKTDLPFGFQWIKPTEGDDANHPGGPPLLEEELTIVGKALFTLLLVGYGVVCVLRFFRGAVPGPLGLSLLLFGFSLFVISKISLFKTGRWLSFGPRELSPMMDNFYRLGYWFMGMGLLLGLSPGM